MTTPIQVAICVATYRRNAQLLRLLEALETLTFRAVSEPDIAVVIVDNDPLGSGDPAVRAFHSARYRISYYHETRRGISYARNTAIEAAGDADFIAFIDDDEQPSHAWLDRLLAAQLTFAAPIVAGRVVPLLEESSFHFVPVRLRRSSCATGTRMQSASTANVLIASYVLRFMGPEWFDPRYAVTGGEDTHFFRRCLAANIPIVWADDAIVYESIPPARLTPEYLCARARNGANHWTRVEIELHGSPVNLALRFGVGILRVLQGSTIKFFSRHSDRQQEIAGDLLLAEGVGNLHAFFGGRYEMYGAIER